MQIDGLTYLDRLALLAEKNNYIEPDLYEKYNVKRGLRNSDGTGVLVGLTEIGEVHGYILDEGERIPDQGRLLYRGIDIWDIVKGFQKEGRYGFEEVCYLLLFGELPDRQWLEEFTNLLAENRCLPDGFVEDMILKAPSNDIMNKLARSVLASYSYDKNPDDLSIKNVVRQSIELIARFPIMVAYGYQAKVHFYENQSLYIHLPRKDLSTAENFLYMIRPDNHYTRLEAELLDLALVLHAEHGGGNNSTFTVHVVSSTGTDIYSVIAAAVGSLKGPKHGGANIKVMEMIDDIKANVRDWADEEEIKYYLTKILNKEAFDKKGLIYGLGHAVYTLSDPRAVLLKNKAAELAREKNMEEEFGLYLTIEKVAPELFAAKKGTEKIIAPNVDFYSGFVYKMLNIPVELYTPIFAIARISGWCAHLLEELVSGGRIIRPAYKNVIGKRKYIPLEQR
ncbi:Citrate synthase, bacterial-type [Moorella glycerini]|uniref:Citrate synthase n=1 Tax=Neomoorella stamsii TaxID=1266720 RepID=A0A9X7J1B9_9FIRM|nr:MULTISPECIES: citrate/2-methylcitrate synthase [Moorella]PRR71744.1 Citrate synthase [Moorella stamsii]CEP66878.1 Citrate synthase, bacterial-type [Moorella glycerini]